MRIATIAGKRIATIVAATAVGLALYAAPAMAQGFSFSINFGNWYGYHHSWAQRCYASPRYGHWGREGRWESWCASNARFRYGRPDAHWRHDHPWDYGREGDRRR